MTAWAVLLGAGAGDDGNAAVYPLDYMFDHLQVFFVLQSRGFSRGAAGQNRVGVAGQLIFQDAVNLSVIYAAVGIHGGDHCKTGTGENGCFHDQNAPFAVAAPHAAAKPMVSHCILFDRPRSQNCLSSPAGVRRRGFIKNSTTNAKTQQKHTVLPPAGLLPSILLRLLAPILWSMDCSTSSG